MPETNLPPASGSREHASNQRVGPTRLCDFLREHLDAIVAVWSERARGLAGTRGLTNLALIDHLPTLLGHVADAVESVHTGKGATLGDAPIRHAIDRLARGFDVEAVVEEYALLRRTIFDVWEREVGPAIDVAEARRLDEAIDRTIALTTSSFTDGRDRLLRALDRIAEASLGPVEVESFLPTLAHAALEHVPTADVVVVLLREDERLRVGAAAGAAPSQMAWLACAVGEGLAGTIAATRKPLFARDASTHPLVSSAGPAAAPLHATYGVPLLAGGDAIGVAIMGTRSAHAFSEDEKLLLRTAAVRAASVIVQARLVKDITEAHARERAARADAEGAFALVDGLLSASPLGIGFLDPELRFLRVNDAFAAIDARPPAEHVGLPIAELLPPDATWVEALIRRVLATGEPALNVEVIAKSAARAFSISYFRVGRADGHVLGVGIIVVEITDQKHAAEERERLVSRLADERSWLEAVLEQLPSGVVIADAASGEPLFANRRTAAILGWPTASRVVDLAGAGVAPEERPLARARRGETVTGHEIVVRGVDDRPVTIHVNAAPVCAEDGRVLAAVVTFDDVTDARRSAERDKFLADASKALSESLEQDVALETIARLAVPRVADGCVIQVASESGRDPVGVVAHVDPAKVVVLQELRRRYPREAPRRSELHAKIADDDLAARAVDAEHLSLLSRVEARSEIVVPLVVRGRTLGAISFVASGARRSFDTKDVEMAEELARRVAMTLENARLLREAREATQLREEVLAVVSHDLRNPLNAIVVGASVLEQKLAHDPSRKTLETILRAATRMTHLLGSLLDIASLRAGRLAIDRAPHDLDALVAEAIQVAEPLATEKGIRVERSPILEGVVISCDRERLLQVFSNLLGNAIKFGRERDVVRVHADATDAEVRFTVEDTGPGISAEELPHLFEPYWSAARHASKGTGLGLFIAKGIVEAHGGRIWAESEAGAGATFRFVLPRVDGGGRTA